MAEKVPRVKLNDGNEIPILGLGTWKSSPGKLHQAVRDAIDIGYRLIDCTPVWDNEKEIGSAIREKIAEGVVRREELFVISKLGKASLFSNPDLIKTSLKVSLSRLELEYVDLYLLNWSYAETVKRSDGLLRHIDPINYIHMWRGMEAACREGLTKSIGVSNFQIDQLEKLLEHAEIPPVTNEIENHPLRPQLKLSNYCESKNIVVTAYGPLCSPSRPWAMPNDDQLLENPKLLNLTKKYKKTPAQVLIRYQIAWGHVVVPKSVTKEHLIQNFDVFDFKLSQDDISYFNSLDCEKTRRQLEETDHNAHRYSVLWY